MTAVDRRPGRPRDARVDAAIVDATITEIADRGFAGATIDGIAARAGVGKATIYRRWRNKEDLLRFVAHQLTDSCIADDSGDLRADLLSIFQPLASQFFEGDLGRLLPTFVAEAARDDAMRDLVREIAQERRAPAFEAIERARARGAIGEVDAEAIVDMIGGAFVYRILILGLPIDDDYAAKVIDQALAGVVT